MKSVQQLPNVRRVSAAVSLALSPGLPFAALPRRAGLAFAARAEAPKVTWQGPLSGAVISGTISGSTCAVDATSGIGMDVVSFWMDNYQILNDYSAPFNCSFDTKTFSDGPHT